MARAAAPIHRIPISQVRTNLGQIVRRARLNGECFIVEQGGVPVAGIMNLDDMEDYLELRDPGVKRQIAQSYRDYGQGRVRDARVFVAELRREASKLKKRT
jgi:antitoxin (DNA-binding transcriptional repressor) of toxin-antitoxin stability system